MAWLKILHPFMIQRENGVSHQFLAGEALVPDDLLGHPRVLANTAPVALAPAPPTPPVEALSAPHGAERAKDELVAQADALGVSIDRRWSAARIADAIKAAAEK
ncbi:MAG TPA: hypothetical protein PLG56_00145 [Lacunisphaera sp.]|nr:hypothetical protein [Lacunisphaera sp.]